MSQKIDLLLVESLPRPVLDQLETNFVLHHYEDVTKLGNLALKIRAIATGGGSGVPADLMAALPNLEIIAVNGVGTDAINLEEARKRGIHVSITTGLVTNDVADMAMMLILALQRQLCHNEAWLRSGQWAQGNPPLARSLTGAKLGLAGFGHISQAIAKRANSFGMDIAYYNRHQKETSLNFIPDLADLAKWADILVVAVSGGPATANLINAEILEALGPDGVIVNIARGSIIDETALLDALKNRKIRGAGLDVFQNEPKINPEFFTLKNTVLQPHQASATRETRLKMGENVAANLLAHFEGRPLITPLI